MDWLWVVLMAAGGLVGLLAAFAAVMYLIGRGMSPGHRHTCVLRLRQPAEAVYEAIADVRAWPAWDRGVNRVEVEVDAAGVLRGTMFMGRNVMGIEATRIEPPRLHEIHVEDLGAKIFSGTWRYEITSTDDGCEVRLTEEGEIHAAVPRAMARKLADPRMYLKRHLRVLARKFGEPAKIATVA